MITREQAMKLARESYEKGADDAMASLTEALAEMKQQGCVALEVDGLIKFINTDLRALDKPHN